MHAHSAVAEREHQLLGQRMIDAIDHALTALSGRATEEQLVEVLAGFRRLASKPHVERHDGAMRLTSALDVLRGSGSSERAESERLLVLLAVRDLLQHRRQCNYAAQCAVTAVAQLGCCIGRRAARARSVSSGHQYILLRLRHGASRAVPGWTARMGA